MSAAPPFGLILPGRSVLTNPTVISPTQYAFAFPATPSFSHIVVFLLPGITLPNDSAAGVYIQLPGSTDFKLLGAIGTEKQSAVYRVGGVASSGTNNGNGVAEDEMDATSATLNDAARSRDVIVGVSIEPIAAISAQLEALKTSQSTALVAIKGQQRHPTAPSTRVLAQRIIENAFNFLASFAGSTTGPGGQDMVPLRSFQDWWSKFERRIENEPGFLEKAAEP
ncbi:protein Hikeshi, partial [Lecanoromycetidae sp. Uapishka_2]